MNLSANCIISHARSFIYTQNPSFNYYNEKIFKKITKLFVSSEVEPYIYKLFIIIS